MNVQQVKSDFENRVLISRATLGALIDHALAMEAARHEAIERETLGDFDKGTGIYASRDTDNIDAAEVVHALADMALKRQASDATKRMNANIDAQMAAVDAARVAKRDRRVEAVPVEFDRRASAEDRRSGVRRLDLRRTEDK